MTFPVIIAIITASVVHGPSLQGGNSAKGGQNGCFSAAAHQNPVNRIDEVTEKIRVLCEGRRDDPEKIVRAIKWLGDHKASVGIPVLVRYLDFEVVHKPSPGSTGLAVKDVDQWIPTGGDYPAVEALFQIGNIALPSLSEVIENHEIDSLLSKNALSTIQLIFREDPSMSVVYLKKKASGSTSDEARRRLLLAAERSEESQKRLNSIINNH